MDENRRLGYIDACKAVGIICVILGHTYYGPDVLYNLICSFHMPLFFVLSGFTWDEKKYKAMPFKTFIKKKAKDLLVPYFVFAAVNLLIQVLWKLILLHEKADFAYLGKSIKSIILCYSSMEFMPNCSPIWFLLCLFVADLLLYWMMRLQKRNTVILALLCMGFSYYLSFYPYEYDLYPWKFPIFFMGVFFMVVGHGLRHYVLNRDFSRSLAANAVCIGMIIAAGIIEVLTDNPVIMNENQYGNLLVFLLTSVFISASLLILCRNSRAVNQCGPLAWLGKNTIYIVGFNYVCRDIATELYYYIPFLKTRKISFLPVFFITFLLCIMIIILCQKVKELYRQWHSYA